MARKTFGSKLRAKDGCVMFFPRRKSHQLVWSSTVTRRRWAEEWVQIEVNSPIEVELDFSGASAIDLGKGLKCEVIAAASAEVDRRDLVSSVPRIIERFLCSTTADPDVVLGATFFKVPLRTWFKSLVLESMDGLSYEEILDDFTTVETELKTQVRKATETCFSEAGLRRLDTRIRILPLDPGLIGREPAIVKRWAEWKETHFRLEQDEAQAQKRREYENKTAELKLKEAYEADARAMELREEAALRKHEEAKAEIRKDREAIKQNANIEIERLRAQNKTESAELTKGEDKLNHEIEEAKQTLAKAAKLQEIEDRHDLEKRRIETAREESLARIEQDQQARRRESELERALKLETAAEDRAEEARKRQHEFDMQRLEMEAHEERRQAATLEKEVAALEAEAEIARSNASRERGLAEASIREALMRADVAGDLELSRIQIQALADIQRFLPTFLKSVPTERFENATLISVDGRGEGMGLSSALETLGLVYIPIVEKILGRRIGASDDLPTAEPASGGASVASGPEQQGADTSAGRRAETRQEAPSDRATDGTADSTVRGPQRAPDEEGIPEVAAAAR